jgi:RNA recognition motif-containing protein
VFFDKYKSCKSAKVVVDMNNNSKGYGFVRFGSEDEQLKALDEMKDIKIMDRRIRVSLATQRHYQPNRIVNNLDDDLNCTTVFVGGLTSDVTELDLVRYDI